MLKKSNIEFRLLPIIRVFILRVLNPGNGTAHAWDYDVMVRGEFHFGFVWDGPHF